MLAVFKRKIRNYALFYTDQGQVYIESEPLKLGDLANNLTLE